ncbi:hypothetical protein JB92DRAFT_2837122 [Gautieria morchelliformis]|nr:hypothetical protein JB92DRAFT_2837122 [Gautieria morchelliformis]
MIKPDKLLYCSFNNIGVIWMLLARLSFIQHASEVMEIQIKKDKTMTRACCPEIYFQWHPFTLTSAPKKDYISVHVWVAGDSTSALAATLGCEFHSKQKGGPMSTHPSTRSFPVSWLMDFSNYGTVLLVGAGIGVTPLPSILKSISYQMTSFNNSKSTRLSKVYFTWVISDFGMAHQFYSLLRDRGAGDEEPDSDQHLPHGQGQGRRHEQRNGAEKDAITSLLDKHPDTDVGVCFCGPPVLSKTSHVMYTKPKVHGFSLASMTSVWYLKIPFWQLLSSIQSSPPSSLLLSDVRCLRRHFVHVSVVGGKLQNVAPMDERVEAVGTPDTLIVGVDPPE